MYGPFSRCLWAGLLAIAACWNLCQAQEAPTVRPLAPGVLTVIPVANEVAETFTGPVPLTEVVAGMPELDWTPNFDPRSYTLREMAKQVIFRRPIWNLEFAFKPLRMIQVDVPQPSGKMQRKLVWYLVYRVKNNGYDLNPVGTNDRWGHTVYRTENVMLEPLRFFPHFILRSVEFEKEYLDRVIPAAQRAIQARENPGVTLLNSIEMTREKIPLSDERIDRSVWGVVTWEDVDPRIDYFSVFVRGLTNAFQFEDPPGAFVPGSAPGTGRVYRYKALQLNFWRPGDAVLEHEREIRYGIPLDRDPAIQQQIIDKFGLEEPLDHLWVYR